MLCNFICSYLLKFISLCNVYIIYKVYIFVKVSLYSVYIIEKVYL